MLPKPFYLISDGSRLREEGTLLDYLELALRGGGGRIGYFQLREQVGEKPATDAELTSLALLAKPICSEYGCKLIVSKNVDVAEIIDADGVHLGADLGALSRLRNSTKKILGYSAHSAAEVKSGFASGADYVLFAPIFSPISKNTSQTPLGLESIKQAAADNPGKNIFALGGVTLENFQSCLGAGASGVAMISSILLSANPCEMASKFAGKRLT